MGWWRETIDIVKKMTQQRVPRWRSFDLSRRQSTGCSPCFSLLWNHGFKLLARMHSQFWRFWTQIEIHPGATIASGVFIDHGAGLVIGETAIVEKGVMLYHGVTLGEQGRMSVNAIQRFVKEPWSPLMPGHRSDWDWGQGQSRSRSGRGLRCTSDVTVVGVPAKIVRVHGKKDEPIIHQEEENANTTWIRWSMPRKPVIGLLACKEIATWFKQPIHWMTTNYWKQRPLLPSVRSMTELFGILISPICSILIPICPPFSFIMKKRWTCWPINGLCRWPDVEVAILVHPNHRRQGIARALYRSFETETASYPIESVTFQTERVFLERHPEFASNWGLVEDEETETWLGKDRRPYPLATVSNLDVLLADRSYQDQISQLKFQAFSEEHGI